MNREVSELGSRPEHRQLRTLGGKRAIVTGSTSGIGAGIAVALAEAGCDVMLNGFGEPEVIQRQADGIAKQHSVRVSFNSADLGKASDVAQMVEAAIAKFG